VIAPTATGRVASTRTVTGPRVIARKATAPMVTVRRARARSGRAVASAVEAVVVAAEAAPPR
jgi:hypothetical protein